MKQTAVEWLVEQISSSKYFYNLMEDINSRSTVAQSNILEQAKEMERQQIMSAFTRGDIFGADYYDGVNITEENYYKQTFKSE
jgi:hypothetical protein